MDFETDPQANLWLLVANTWWDRCNARPRSKRSFCAHLPSLPGVVLPETHGRHAPTANLAVAHAMRAPAPQWGAPTVLGGGGRGGLDYEKVGAAVLDFQSDCPELGACMTHHLVEGCFSEYENLKLNTIRTNVLYYVMYTVIICHLLIMYH